MPGEDGSVHSRFEQLMRITTSNRKAEQLGQDVLGEAEDGLWQGGGEGCLVRKWKRKYADEHEQKHLLPKRQS